MRYDFVIVGGGLVGAGLSVALRDLGLRLALVDARLPSNQDHRLFALNESSCEFLKNISLWDKLEKLVTPIQQVHISQRGHFGSVRLRAEDVRLSSLGHVIPARYVEGALNEALLSSIHIDIIRPAKLVELKIENEEVALKLQTDSGEKVIRSAFVVGADGAESTVRALSHIETDTTDYQQSALVTRTTLKRSHHHIAYERFTDGGAIAMLPLGDHECATIWSADTTKIQSLLKLSDQDFVKALQETFGYRLGSFANCAARYSYPLKQIRAKSMTKDRVLLLGNAAHTLHPIAAQGFNLALYEVAMLVEKISAKQTAGEAFSPHDFKMIAEEVQSHQSAILNFSHRMTTAFSIRTAWMSVLSSLAMVGMNAFTPIKKHFIRRMTGRAGSVPALMLRGKDL